MREELLYVELGLAVLEEEGLDQLVLEEGRVVVEEGRVVLEDGVLELFWEGRAYWLDGAGLGVVLGRVTGVVVVRLGVTLVRLVLVGVLLVGFGLGLMLAFVLEVEELVLSAAVLDAGLDAVLAGVAAGLAVLPDPEGE